jgi:ABC-type uncharacterized transport system substrate-binding protein
VARAQQTEGVRRVGLLTNFAERDAELQARITAFRAALQEFGWIEGVTVRVEYRYGAGDSYRLHTFAQELTGLSPDVLHSIGSPATTALRDATNTIPIVFAQVADPVGSGLVDNIARPSGNITGFTNYEYSIGGKWLEILKEIGPSVRRVLILQNSANMSAPGLLHAIQIAAGSVNIEVAAFDVTETGWSVDKFARESHGGLIVLPDANTATHRERIISAAILHQLPAVYPYRSYITDGGLVSYGIVTSYQSRQTAAYVNRILRGARPGELPVQAPSKFELVINLTTAKAMGLEVPPTLLARADEVIE